MSHLFVLVLLVLALVALCGLPAVTACMLSARLSHRDEE